MNIHKDNQEYLVQKLLAQYTEKEHTALDELKALDKKVTAPVCAFACLFGSAAALIMGAGMSLIMTDLSQRLGLAEPMLPGLIIGISGMLMAIFNYPIYRRLLRSRRGKYAEKILALSNQLTQN